MMDIVRLQTLTKAQVEQVKRLMSELNPDIPVTTEMITDTVRSEGTAFFAVLEGEEIVGCASLGVFYSPTGCKGHIEDVVVLSAYRGQGLGRKLMEHVIDFARREYKDIDLYLTSRPVRVAANKLYQALGFRRKETNVYKMTTTL